MDLLGCPVRWPIVGAPMAGGPSTPALTAAVSRGGGLGLLAGAYLTAEVLEQQIVEVRARGESSFGVNLFVPGDPEVDEVALGTYLESLRPEAEKFGVETTPVWDDDHFPEKLELVCRHHVPVVSFTFGCPPSDVVAHLHDLGTQVVITVTTPAEARAATESGADAICAQGVEAGGHQSNFDDDTAPDAGWGLLALVTAIRHEVSLPVIAAGGVMTGAAVARRRPCRRRGSTVGDSPFAVPREWRLGDTQGRPGGPRFTSTSITRAFSGRRARGLVNDFMRAHPDAPSAYPHINNATRALRLAALARSDPQATNLWAGQGFRLAQERPAAEIIATIGAEFEALPT